MTVGFSKQRNPEHIPEHLLWTLHKNGKTAEARTRMVPAGPELRIYYNGAFLRSQVVRDRNVGDAAEEAKQQWIARGWTEQAPR